MSGLAGRVAVVTGGAKGIGLGIARRLAKSGAKVAIFDRDADAIKQALADRDPGAELAGFSVDVSNAAAVSAAFDDVSRWAGPADLLVNNAGIVRDMRFARIEESDWDAVLDTNLKSMFLCCKAALPGMAERGFGRIVNMSARAWLGSFGQASYSAAKGGAISLTRSLALEFAGKGVTVNAIAPGIIDTPLFRSFKPEVREKLQASVPVRRIGDVDDVALAVEFFLQPAASYLTGQTLYVCGGRSLASPSV